MSGTGTGTDEQVEVEGNGLQDAPQQTEETEETEETQETEEMRCLAKRPSFRFLIALEPMRSIVNHLQYNVITLSFARP